MGAKKNGMTILAGSLKKHWMMYVTELNMKVNPTDLHAVSMGNTLLSSLATTKSQYIQPGFTYKHIFGEKDMRYHDPSVLHLKFVNGQEMQYHMGLNRLNQIKEDIKRINHYIEFERSLAGQDDELEDEAI